MWLPFTPLYALQGLGELAGFIFGTCISPWRSETLLKYVTWQVGSSENRPGPLYRLLGPMCGIGLLSCHPLHLPHPSTY